MWRGVASTIRASRAPLRRLATRCGKRGARTGTATVCRVAASGRTVGAGSWNLDGAASATADAVYAEHEQDEQNDDDDWEHVTS